MSASWLVAGLFAAGALAWLLPPLWRHREPPVDAASLDQRLGRWAYQVPAWVHDRLTTPRAALLEGG